MSRREMVETTLAECGDIGNGASNNLLRAIEKSEEECFRACIAYARVAALVDRIRELKEGLPF